MREWRVFVYLIQDEPDFQDLTGKCVDGAIADNIEELVDSSDWLSLPADCVEAILKSSSLLVPDEFYLFEALQRWFMSRRKAGPDDQVMDELRKVLIETYLFCKDACGGPVLSDKTKSWKTICNSNLFLRKWKTALFRMLFSRKQSNVPNSQQTKVRNVPH